MSPDGRWLAYQSDESGRAEIYIRPFPNVNTARFKISTDGGTRPAWARNGRELFYMAGISPGPVSLTAVLVQAGSTLTAGRPQKLFEGQYFGTRGFLGRPYDVASDGRRFLMIKDQSGERTSTPSELVVVLNFFDELNRLAPPNR
jgi:serine/threonine-protein kinase